MRIALATMAVAAGAGAQAVTGIGFALVCAPFLIALTGAREGVRTAILLGLVINVAMLVREHRNVMVREGSLLLVPALAATPLLAWALARVDTETLAVAAGVLTLASAAALFVGLRVAMARGAAGAVVAGFVSAAMNVIAAIGGPAVALYAVNAGWEPARARSTLQFYFFFLGVVGLLSLGLPSPSLVLAVGMVGLVAGWVAGTALAPRIPDRVVRVAVLGVASAGGVVAILTNV